METKRLYTKLMHYKQNWTSTADCTRVVTCCWQEDRHERVPEQWTVTTTTWRWRRGWREWTKLSLAYRRRKQSNTDLRVKCAKEMWRETLSCLAKMCLALGMVWVNSFTFIFGNRIESRSVGALLGKYQEKYLGENVQWQHVGGDRLCHRQCGQ